MEIMNILEMIIRMIMKVMNINLLVKIKVMKMVIIKSNDCYNGNVDGDDYAKNSTY